MNALSRREEEVLLKTAKAHALKQCDAVVKGACLIPVITILIPLTVCTFTIFVLSIIKSTK